MIPLLIVDDESIIRETIAAMLRRKYPDQFHIFLASNGQEALSLVASENVELVLADIKMPVMNGLELLHRLHEQQFQCDVIFISGFDDYSFVREAMKSGAVDYLLKPIAENELYAQIDSFLKRAALRVPIHTARVRPEENVYLQQYVLDKLFDSNGIVPDGVLAELHLTPSSPAALLAAPVVSSEADLQWFQQVHEAIQPLLQTGCALFQGRKRQMCLSLCIFPDQSQYTAMGGLLPGNSAQVFSPMFLLPHAPEQLSVCQTLLERRFFDLPGEDGPETYPYSTLISDLTDAICRLQVESYHQTLLLLLRRACAQYPPVDSLRQLLCGMIYATLQGNSSFVAVFSQMELTADDIICAIQQTPFRRSALPQHDPHHRPADQPHTGTDHHQRRDPRQARLRIHSGPFCRGFHPDRSGRASGAPSQLRQHHFPQGLRHVLQPLPQASAHGGSLPPDPGDQRQVLSHRQQGGLPGRSQLCPGL